MSTKIMAKVWPLELKPTLKLVAISLADQANDEGVCWPSVSSMMTRTCLGERTVRRAIGELADLHVITIFEQQGKSNTFAFNLDVLDQLGLFDPCHSGRGATAAGVPQRQGTPATAAGDPCHSGTHNRKEPSLNRHGGNARSAPPATTSPGKVKRSRRVPADWQPTEGHRRIAAESRVSLDAELAQFRDHEFARPMSDWDAAFRNWLRRAARFGGGPNGPSGKPSAYDRIRQAAADEFDLD